MSCVWIVINFHLIWHLCLILLYFWVNDIQFFYIEIIIHTKIAISSISISLSMTIKIKVNSLSHKISVLITSLNIPDIYFVWIPGHVDLMHDVVGILLYILDTIENSNTKFNKLIVRNWNLLKILQINISLSSSVNLRFWLETNMV